MTSHWAIADDFQVILDSFGKLVFGRKSPRANRGVIDAPLLKPLDHKKELMFMVPANVVVGCTRLLSK